jgi:hypothetical protein
MVGETFWPQDELVRKERFDFIIYSEVSALRACRRSLPP